MNNNNDDIHDCQCDSGGYCPVYKAEMNARRFQKCKNDASWRRAYRDFFNTIQSPSFHESVRQQPEYKAMEKAIQDRITENEEEHKKQMELNRQYMLQHKEREMAYFQSLSPEEQKRYKKRASEYIERRDKARSEHQAEQQQLQQVIDNIQEAGVTSENYQENTEGLGDLISNALSKIGVTEETVKKWSGTQKEGCGCDKRKKFLNAILPFRKKE